VADPGDDADKWLKMLVAKQPTQSVLVDLPVVGAIKTRDGTRKATVMMLLFDGAKSERIAFVKGALLLSDSTNQERLLHFQAAVLEPHIKAVVGAAMQRENAHVEKLRAVAADETKDAVTRAAAAAKVEYAAARETAAPTPPSTQSYARDATLPTQHASSAATAAPPDTQPATAGTLKRKMTQQRLTLVPKATRPDDASGHTAANPHLQRTAHPTTAPELLRQPKHQRKAEAPRPNPRPNPDPTEPTPQLQMAPTAAPQPNRHRPRRATKKAPNGRKAATRKND
jgi:hypothetical protein